MHEEIFRALEEGATVITAGRRLARVLAREFHALRSGARAHGLESSGRFAAGRFSGSGMGRVAGRPGETKTLRYCWMRRRSKCCGSGLSANRPRARRCCRFPKPRGKAMETWRLMAEYRLPVDGSFEASEDWAAFAQLVARVSATGAARTGGWSVRGLSDFLRQTKCRGTRRSFRRGLR